MAPPLRYAHGVAYRDQPYVDRPGPLLVLRCYCGAEAVASCQACRRPRCAEHLTAALCRRCSDAVERALSAANHRYIWPGFVSAFGGAVTLLVLHLVSATLLALPAGVLVSVMMRRRERARLIRQLGPRLSATVGELPPPPDEPEFPTAPPPQTF